MRVRRFTTCVVTVWLLAAAAATAEVEVLKDPVEVEVHFPEALDYEVELDDDWTGVRELRVSVGLPDDVPRGTTMLCYLKDEQWNWYQHEPSGSLRSGKTNQIRIDMSPGSENWFPRGHIRQWDGYVAHKIRGFGIKVFNNATWHGKIRIERVYGRTGDRAEQPLAVTGLRVNTDRVPCFEKFEISFDLTRTYANPFDPEEIDIDVTFTSPSGKTYPHTGFHYREYVRRRSPLGYERLTPVGQSYWKVRWTPNEVGTWKAELTLWDHHQQKLWKQAVADAAAAAQETAEPVDPPKREDFLVRVKPITFECTPSKSHGFIRVDPNDRFFFSYEDGTFWYPVGQMLRSPVDLRKPYKGYEREFHEGEGTYAFERMMGKLATNGCNFIRVWMGIWWVGLEGPRDYAPGYEGLGRYNMKNAWKLDHILDEAHRLDMKLKLNLNNHGQFTRNVDHEWYENCYNEMNGGMLTSPAAFWQDAEARKYYRRRLRYVVSRWAYSPDIMGWEMWNEVDLTEGFNAGVVAMWHREFARHLKEIDPWKHPISTHFCHDQDAGAVYSLPEIEFTPGDLYQTNIVTAMRNKWLEKKGYNKATFISEYGVGHDRDQMESNFHGGLWSSTVVPMAGTAMFWWWNFVDAEDLYYHYKPVALFNAGEDRRGKNWELTSADVRRGENRHAELRVLGRQDNSEAHLWVYDSDIYSRNDGNRYRHPPTFVGCVLWVPGLATGTYTVEFWNTCTGKVIQTETVNHRKDTFQVPLPKVQADLAVKIKRTGG